MGQTSLILIGTPLGIYFIAAIASSGTVNSLPYCLTIAGYTFACVDLLNTGVLVAIFVTLLGVGILTGITILGSGISVESQKLIFVIASMLMISGFVSALGIPEILTIPHGIYLVGIFSAMTILGTVAMGSQPAG